MSQDQTDTRLTRAEARGVRAARELEGHLTWLDTFSGTALGVLSVASGIYTYLGVSSLLDENGAMSVFAAIAYSTAVSVGIFVFWSYMLRLFPAVRTTRARTGLMAAMGLGSLATIAIQAPPNLAIVVFDNERYGETGMQPTHTAFGADLPGVAKASGFPVTGQVDDQGGLDAALPVILKAPGPVFFNIKVRAEDLDFVLPPKEGVILKQRFRQALLGET